MKIVSWFSCGNNSAVTAKLVLDKYKGADVVIARCIVDNEHSDNDRFCRDCEKWLGINILRLKSDEFKDCWEVWEKRRYISGIKGAPCTTEMKKAVRWDFEKKFNPDYQAFGFSVEEKKRADRFRAQNPEVNLLTPLIDEKLTKKDCRNLIESANIEIPFMYKLGFNNNNCIGCAKAGSVVYWARTRHFFPEIFKRMSELSRKLNCRMIIVKGERKFLDELPENIDWKKKDKENIECGLLCVDEK